ncbi:MAG: hypothetical protein ABSF70_06470 [Terracidiphilus sp.]
MSRFIAISILVFSIAGFAQTPHMGFGARVFVEPKNDFERILTASLREEEVPVIIVDDKNEADYIIKTTITQDAGEMFSGFNASMVVIDSRSSQIVFKYSDDRGGYWGVAYEFAIHLNEFIVKQE